MRTRQVNIANSAFIDLQNLQRMIQDELPKKIIKILFWTTTFPIALQVNLFGNCCSRQRLQLMVVVDHFKISNSLKIVIRQGPWHPCDPALAEPVREDAAKMAKLLSASKIQICCQWHDDVKEGHTWYFGVNFYRFTAKNWHFWQSLREKVAFFFTGLTRKIGVFRCKFYSPKILPV